MKHANINNHIHCMHYFQNRETMRRYFFACILWSYSMYRMKLLAEFFKPYKFMWPTVYKYTKKNISLPYIWKIFFVLVTRLRSFFKKHLCTFMLRVFVPKVPRDFRNLNLGLLSMCKMMSYHARKVLGNNMLCEWAWSLPEPLIKHDYLFLEYFFATSSVTSLPNWHFWSWTILNLTHNKN